MYPEIEVAKWDSEFFQYKVGRVDLPTSCAPESVERFADALVRQAHEQKFRLVYVFVGSPLESQSLSNLARRGFRDVGGKREYAREPVCISLPEDGSSEIVICREVSPSIVNLALQSSALSRFRLDPGFAENEYERLYTEWICKAVEGVDGLCAYIIGAVDEPKGLITLDSAGGEARIGLLAVDGRSRRHGRPRRRHGCRPLHQYHVLRNRRTHHAADHPRTVQRSRFWKQAGIFPQDWLYRFR